MLREGDYIGKRAKKSGFVPSVDCSISLFIDPRRSDQVCSPTASLTAAGKLIARYIVVRTKHWPVASSMVCCTPSPRMAAVTGSPSTLTLHSFRLFQSLLSSAQARLQFRVPALDRMHVLCSLCEALCLSRMAPGKT